MPIEIGGEELGGAEGHEGVDQADPELVLPFDGARFGIHVRDVILGGAIVLSGGNQHRIFHRVEDDLRVDALFLAQDFDGLKNRFHNASLYAIQICW